MKYHYNLYVFVAVLFVAGGIFGALLVNALTFEQQQQLAGEVERYLYFMSAGAGPGETAVFWERFMFHLKWLLLIWILGITVVGVPGVLALNFLKGTVVGFSVGALTQQYAWKGVLFAIVSIAPQNLLAIPALVVTSAAAISFALYVVKNRLMRQRGELLPQLGSFTSTTIIMLFLFAGVALFEAYVSPSLINWISPFVSSSGAGI